MTWPNGAIATTFSSEDADRLRGPEHDAAWAAIWLSPSQIRAGGFPDPALPEGNPRHIRACAQVRVMRGTGRRKRAVRVSNSGQPMRRLF